jgi:hypothetical protein
MVITGGKWQTNDCTTMKPFVCEVFEETYSAQSQCRDGYSYYAEWNSCYKVQLTIAKPPFMGDWIQGGSLARGFYIGKCSPGPTGGLSMVTVYRGGGLARVDWNKIVRRSHS